MQTPTVHAPLRGHEVVEGSADYLALATLKPASPQGLREEGRGTVIEGLHIGFQSHLDTGPRDQCTWWSVT